MSEKRQKSIPGQRITSGFARIADLAEKLGEEVREVQDHIYDDRDSIVIFEVKKRKPFVIVAGPDGITGSEKFNDAVDRLAEEEDIPELDVWAKAFEQASRKLKTRIGLIRKKPRNT